MANYLLKSDSFGIEPAEFEDLGNESSRVVRAYKHGRKSNEEVTEHPLAKNFIRHTAADARPEPVEVCISPLFETPESLASLPKEKDPEEIIEAARLAEIKLEWDAAWQIKLDHQLEKARLAGYETGYLDAKTALAEEISLEKEAFTFALETLQGTWENFINRSETLLLEIALEIAHFLVDVPLPESVSKSTETALLQALEGLARDVPVQLSLNPVDFLRLRESGLTKHIENQFSTLRWDPQPTLKEGNWIVQTPREAIRRVSEELLASLRDRFGLNENTQRDLVPRQKPAVPEDHQIPPVTNIAVTTTAMSNQKEIDLSSPMSFSTATSTAAGLNRRSALASAQAASPAPGTVSSETAALNEDSLGEQSANETAQPTAEPIPSQQPETKSGETAPTTQSKPGPESK
ncbi:MAG: hypothetical protein AB8G77_16610 [Rhodothermales bacterium]